MIDAGDFAERVPLPVHLFNQFDLDIGQMPVRIPDVLSHPFHRYNLARIMIRWVEDLLPLCRLDGNGLSMPPFLAQIINRDIAGDRQDPVHKLAFARVITRFRRPQTGKYELNDLARGLFVARCSTGLRINKLYIANKKNHKGKTKKQNHFLHQFVFC